MISIVAFAILLPNRYDSTLEDAVENADPSVVSHCKEDIFCIIDYVALGEDAADAYLGDPAMDIPLQQTASAEIDIVLQGTVSASIWPTCH